MLLANSLGDLPSFGPQSTSHHDQRGIIADGNVEEADTEKEEEEKKEYGPEFRRPATPHAHTAHSLYRVRASDRRFFLGQPCRLTRFLGSPFASRAASSEIYRGLRPFFLILTPLDPAAPSPVHIYVRLLGPHGAKRQILAFRPAACNVRKVSVRSLHTHYMLVWSRS